MLPCCITPSQLLHTIRTLGSVSSWQEAIHGTCGPTVATLIGKENFEDAAAKYPFSSTVVARGR